MDEGGSMGIGSIVSDDQSEQVSPTEAKSTGFGSETPKEEHQWRAPKVLRADDGLSVAKPTTPFHHGTPLLRSERLLSLSSLRPQLAFLSKAAAGSGSFAGPFTPSQWIELEHQALIYKYLNANVPVPTNLLIPVKRSFNPYGLSGSSAGSLHPNSCKSHSISYVGWGSFHLGYSGSPDPNAGRCRRTDGKKWRCTREAVVDQKYCEKHINRGRHRSRKPVEGQITGRAIANSGPAYPKMFSMHSSSSASVVSPTGGGSNYVFALGDTGFDRMPETHAQGVPVSLNSADQVSLAPLPGQEIPLEDCMPMEFGLVSSSSLVNPSLTETYVSFLDFADPDAPNQLLHQFVNNWSEFELDNPVMPEDLLPDRAQLSMSIPVTSYDSSSLAPSSIRRTDELGSCDQHNSWRSSLGGPLGEVLNTSLMVSSPTGVLQQNLSFGSQSNSSSASSPMAQSAISHESFSLCDDVFCSTTAAIPSM